jgi:hypothetical protein
MTYFSDSFTDAVKSIMEKKSLEDVMAEREAKRQHAMDNYHYPADLKTPEQKRSEAGGVKVKGNSYGADYSDEEGKEDDERSKVVAPVVKRGRGRPRGSKSGSRA